MGITPNNNMPEKSPAGPPPAKDAAGSRDAGKLPPVPDKPRASAPLQVISGKNFRLSTSLDRCANGAEATTGQVTLDILDHAKQVIATYSTPPGLLPGFACQLVAQFIVNNRHNPEKALKECGAFLFKARSIDWRCLRPTPAAVPVKSIPGLFRHLPNIVDFVDRNPDARDIFAASLRQGDRVERASFQVARDSGTLKITLSTGSDADDQLQSRFFCVDSGCPATTPATQAIKRLLALSKQAATIFTTRGASALEEFLESADLSVYELPASAASRKALDERLNAGRIDENRAMKRVNEETGFEVKLEIGHTAAAIQLSLASPDNNLYVTTVFSAPQGDPCLTDVSRMFLREAFDDLTSDSEPRRIFALSRLQAGGYDRALSYSVGGVTGDNYGSRLAQLFKLRHSVLTPRLTLSDVAAPEVLELLDSLPEITAVIVEPTSMLGAWRLSEGAQTLMYDYSPETLRLHRDCFSRLLVSRENDQSLYVELQNGFGSLYTVRIPATPDRSPVDIECDLIEAFAAQPTEGWTCVLQAMQGSTPESSPIPIVPPAWEPRLHNIPDFRDPLAIRSMSTAALLADHLQFHTMSLPEPECHYRREGQVDLSFDDQSDGPQVSLVIRGSDVKGVYVSTKARNASKDTAETIIKARFMSEDGIETTSKLWGELRDSLVKLYHDRAKYKYSRSETSGAADERKLIEFLQKRLTRVS